MNGWTSTREVEKKTTKTEQRIQLAAAALKKAAELRTSADSLEGLLGRSRLVVQLDAAAQLLEKCGRMLPPAGSLPIIPKG